MLGILKALWSYKNFILNSVRNEFVIRFSRSALGGLWVILQPLAQVAIYALILSAVLSAKLPGIDNQYAYAIYLTAGMLAWSLFSEIITRCLNLFIEQSNLMKKMMFPRVTLPAIVVGSSLLNNAMLFVAIIAVFALLGHMPSMHILWLPLITLFVVAFSMGLGLILGVLNVFIRDIGQVVPIILQVAFWFTPIVYPISIIPEGYRDLLAYNPMYPIVKAYQDILVYNVTPDIIAIGWIAFFSLLLLVFGFLLFRRASPEMVDVL
jgi:lipopolysaccharide transport system permease protein